MKPIRTALFAPGNRPDRVEKALGLDADAVIMDLEDAVPFAEKESTRKTVRDLLDKYPGKRMYVRINALNTPYAKGDIAVLGSKNIAGLMVPKVESPDDLIAFGRLVTDLEKDSGLIEGSLEVLSICETAKGLEEIYSIASVKTEPNRDMIIAFGAADYTLDLGISLTREGRELDYPRIRLPIASKAADIGPPLDTPWMVDLKDIDGLVADAQKAKAYGFQGKIVIHPTQIQPCHDVFTPTQAEIDYARKIVEAFEAAERDGKAAIQVDGKFIDYPVVERARRTIELSRVIEDQG
ncbi:MAG: HpcH/HpaI aldolase/citrate lyase family protein [Planctomycetota bacterium]|jgi:citrate lyase subunit beta/citryl-CoA lyase